MKRHKLVRAKQRIVSDGDMPRDVSCYLQSIASHGLCNRLRGWVGIGALADTHNLPFYVWWGCVPDCYANFDELFVADNTIILATEEGGAQLGRVSRFWGGGKVRANTAMRPWYRYRRFTHDKRRFNANVRARLAGLQLVPHLQSKLDDACAELHAAQCVGLHVRRTDLHTESKYDPKLHRYLRAFLGRYPAARFLLCADNIRSVRQFQRRYGKRILWRAQAMGSGKRKTSIQDAAIDLFLLSKTRGIIGTKRSSFSHMAAALGGKKLIRL